jgi:hypothetical protein
VILPLARFLAGEGRVSLPLARFLAGEGRVRVLIRSEGTGIV